MIGAGINKPDIDRVWRDIGKSALKLTLVLADAKAWMDTISVSDLEDAGYTNAEANTMKSVAGELATWGEALTPTFARRVTGPSALLD